MRAGRDDAACSTPRQSHAPRAIVQEARAVRPLRARSTLAHAVARFTRPSKSSRALARDARPYHLAETTRHPRTWRRAPARLLLTSSLVALLSIACGDDAATDAGRVDAATDAQADAGAPSLSWRTTDETSWSFADPHAWVVDSDVIPIVGGDYLDSFNTAILHFNPASETLDMVGMWSMPPDRRPPTLHGSARLQSGAILYVGGGLHELGTRAPSFRVSGQCYLYDGLTAPEPVMPLRVARSYVTATVLDDGSVLAAGGASTEASMDIAAPTAVVERYMPSTRSWVDDDPLANARFQHTATLLPDASVAVVGGIGPAGTPLDSVERYDTRLGAWVAAGGLTQARAAHVAVRLPSGRVLVAGGHTASDRVTSTAELYDPATDRWRAAAPLPVGVAHASIALAPSGDPIVVGGYTESGIGTGIGQAALYLESQDRWVSLPDLPTPRYAAGLSVLSDGRVVVYGGVAAGNVSERTVVVGQWSR